jgi:site-specific recombinase XerD
MNSAPHKRTEKALIKEATLSLPAHHSGDIDLIYRVSSSHDSLNIQDESLLTIVSSYIHYYASGRGHTSRAKKYDLEYFMKFIAGSGRDPGDVQLKEWTMQQTNNFVDALLDKGEAPSTVARRLATIKHLGRTLAERVPGFINPAREVKAPVYETSKPQGLTEEEVRILKQVARHMREESSGSFQSARNCCIIEFLLGTGLRADEIRFLKRGQVSEDRSWLMNVKTKGKRFRDVYIHAELAPLFDDYISRSRAEIVSRFPASLSWNKNEWNTVPVFVSTHRASLLKPESFSLAPKTLWRVIAEFGKKARQMHEEDMPHIHPHKLRHTFAHGLLDASNDIRLVAQALGHSDVRTTMRYTERTKEELAKAIEKKEQK